MDRDNRRSHAKAYFQDLARCLGQVSDADLARVMGVLERAWRNGTKVLIAGNGGSAATASHLANDLMNMPVSGNGAGFMVMALADNAAVLTCIANDHDFDQVFHLPVAHLGRPGDVLLVISGSGNSPNILEALKTAREKGLTTVGFLGMGGGKAKALCDVSVLAPSDDYGLVEDMHMSFVHLLSVYLRNWVRQEIVQEGLGQ